jgi:hypothetical protein
MEIFFPSSSSCRPFFKWWSNWWWIFFKLILCWRCRIYILLLKKSYYKSPKNFWNFPPLPHLHLPCAKKNSLVKSSNFKKYLMQSTLEISKKIFLLKDIHLFKFYKYFFRWRRIYIKIILCDNQRKKSYYILINSSKIISHSYGLKKPEYFTPRTQLSIINILKIFQTLLFAFTQTFSTIKIQNLQ